MTSATHPSPVFPPYTQTAPDRHCLLLFGQGILLSPTWQHVTHMASTLFPWLPSIPSLSPQNSPDWPTGPSAFDTDSEDVEQMRAMGGCNDLVISGHAIVYAVAPLAVQTYYGPGVASSLLWAGVAYSCIRVSSPPHALGWLCVKSVLVWLFCFLRAVCNLSLRLHVLAVSWLCRSQCLMCLASMMCQPCYLAILHRLSDRPSGCLQPLMD